MFDLQVTIIATNAVLEKNHLITAECTMIVKDGKITTPFSLKTRGVNGERAQFPVCLEGILCNNRYFHKFPK